nr:transglycosylase SLT domain-containing protein [Simiduia aestuariiviva]
MAVTGRALTLGLLLLLVGCTTSPPRNPDNLCDIFYEKDDWYDEAKSAEKRWRSPIPTLMAMMHQESRFVAKAKPPRTKILWVIPGPRASSAYGYSQAKDETWEWYQNNSGNGWASRDDFSDAVDFIGWYNYQSGRLANIKPNDTYHLYLAYHEGHGGFKRRTYRKKAWLMNVAKKVSRRANNYRAQLAGCEERLKSSWWPF